MKKLSFTQLTKHKAIRGALSLIVFSFALVLGKLQAQCPANFSTPIPTIACQGQVSTYFITNYDNTAITGYNYSIVPLTGTANYNLVGANLTITYSTPGDVSFNLVLIPVSAAIPCATQTFNVRVGALFAPQANCNDTVNVSLDELCVARVTPDMVLEGNTYNYLDYDVVIRDQITKVTIPGSPLVSRAYLGKFLEVSAIHRCSGNSCWGVLRIEDKLKPILNCKTYIVDCGTPTTPEVLGFPKPVGAPNPTPVVGQPRTYTSNSSFYDNCGPTTFKYNDRKIQVVCPPAVTYIDTIFRDWTANDSYGNQITCSDTILVRAGTTLGLICPPNWDDITHFAIPCDTTIERDANGYPHPNVTGYPTGIGCRNINYTYTDLRLNVCQGSYKILREWLIADWCTGTTATCTQIIKILDKRGPLLVCASRQTVSTAINSCEGWADIKVPTILAGECSSVTWDVLVKRGVEDTTVRPTSIAAVRDGITLNADGSYHVANLPVGLSWVLFIGTDACGNSTECSTEIFVAEKTKPTPVCHFETVVTLSDEGIAKVFASSFDDGSHDNCALDSFKVRRMNPTTNCFGPDGNSVFGSFVKFCCTDIPNNPIVVILQVRDKAGNTNECMVQVTVQDKKPPVITCLPNITVSCGFDYSNLNVFGTYRRNKSDRKQILLNDIRNTLNVPQPYLWGLDGLVIEDCTLTVDSSISNTVNACGVGNISRVYTFRDEFNPAQTCVQNISVINFTPYKGLSIVWPGDVIIEGCLTSSDTARTGAPRWPSNVPCSNIISTYEDQTFNIVEGVCYKILRKWTVVDWCNFNVNTGAGRWTYTQIIKVKNSVAPTITSSCSNQVFDSQSPECNGFAALVATATDDCTHAEDLVWSYKIDLFNNNSIDINGFTNNATGTYPGGTHKITWTVADQCGNETSCTYTFKIRDAKQPTPYCRTGIITVIMPSNGSVVVWASDLNLNSTDNCTPSNQLRYSFSSNVFNTSQTYVCSQITDGISKTFDVRIYVTDLEGNQDYCDTKITIQDGLGNACPDNITGGGTSSLVAGTLSTSNNANLEQAMVSINGNMPSMPKYHMTQKDGKYAFPAIPLSENYTINAEKNDDPLNGVSTQDIVLIQKHILGISTLNTAYKIIAADVNDSKTITAKDISDLRKLILGVTNELPLKKSWRFINASQQFQDQKSPWPLQEVVQIDKLSSDMLENNFIAVKVGDVNGNAKANQLAVSTSRTNAEMFIDLKDLSFVEGQLIEVPFSDLEANTISGLQMEIVFDPEVLHFVEIKSGQLNIHEQNVNYTYVSQGKIRLSWDYATGVLCNKSLFSLVFKGLKKGIVSEHLALGTDSYKSEAYDIEGNEMNIRASYGGNSSTSNNGFYLYQNEPNPFSSVTKISFQLPEDAVANLRVYDVNGKILKELSKQYKAGLNNIEISKKELQASGILYYRLETNNHRAIRKMILIE